MQVFTTAAQLSGFIKEFKKENPNSTLGFVPTMGALHEGHMDLIATAKKKSDFVICSIFVNPTQFNDPKDLARYPRTLENDLDLLRMHGCDFVYTPKVDDIYPGGLHETYDVDFAGLDSVMEGAFRPGHFKGVAQVVERLFTIVTPHIAFFGRKDFQQTVIIRHLVKTKSLPVTIFVAETSRNKEGLALSSRNALLSDSQKEDALIIYKTLLRAKELSKTEKDAVLIKEDLVRFFNQGNLKLEYLEITDDTSLQPVQVIHKQCTCCIAAYCGSVRLIDNIEL